MKRILSFCFLLPSVAAFAGVGPTNIGDLRIGMSKDEYLSVVGVAPINCNTFRDEDGSLNRSEMKYLKSDKKTLCINAAFREKATIENIQVGGLSYDVIEGGDKAIPYLEPIGLRSTAIFLKNRLISLEIYAPKVSYETLATKYGSAKFVDKRSIEVCKNRAGGEFKNNVGKLDAVWVNGEVNSMLRVVNTPPVKTCSDGFDLHYYVLEEPRQLKLIENAIEKYREEITKKTAKDTPF